jgi:hypothetical protein
MDRARDEKKRSMQKKMLQQQQKVTNIKLEQNPQYQEYVQERKAKQDQIKQNYQNTRNLLSNELS